MSKQIRLEDEVYEKLESIRDKRETFSEVVGRLIKIYDSLGLLTSTIQGNKALRESQAKKLGANTKEQEAAIGTDLQGEPLVRRPRT